MQRIIRRHSRCTTHRGGDSIWHAQRRVGTAGAVAHGRWMCVHLLVCRREWKRETWEDGEIESRCVFYVCQCVSDRIYDFSFSPTVMKTEQRLEAASPEIKDRVCQNHLVGQNKILFELVVLESLRTFAHHIWHLICCVCLKCFLIFFYFGLQRFYIVNYCLTMQLYS